MLSVLAFKKSLFAGVLDGGENEVFLGGTRLKRFMETVEKATAAIPAPAGRARGADAGRQAARGLAPEGARARPSRGGGTGQAAAAADPWSGLLQTGLSLLEQLVAASRSPDQPAPRGCDSWSGIRRPATTT